METQDVFLTDDGRQRAIAQLEFLRTTRRSEVAQYLHDAKESGDVVDNAAYEDAKNEQARLEGRILELEQLLASAKRNTGPKFVLVGRRFQARRRRSGNATEPAAESMTGGASCRHRRAAPA